MKPRTSTGASCAPATPWTAPTQSRSTSGPWPRWRYVSEAHFIRSFRVVFGETPHRYLQRRRVERAMFLLRETDRSITDICLDVGFTSLGTFSRMFREIVGETPSAYRVGHGPIIAPNCVQMWATRPRVSASEAAR